MFPVLSGKSRRTSNETLFLFLSEHTIWTLFPREEWREFQDHSPLNVAAVMEQIVACRVDHLFSHMVVLAEYPWIWTRFEQVIPLKRDELLAYVRGGLRFVPDINNLDLPEARVDVKAADSPDPPVKIGAVFLPQNRADRIGLFTAVMSPKSMELERQCRLRFGKNVEWFPLLAACLPRLSTGDQETRLFKTLEHWHFLEWNDGCLRRLLEVPAMEEKVQQKLIPDLLPRTTDAMRIHLVPPENMEPGVSADKQKAPGKETARVQAHHLSIENLVQDLPPPARVPEQGFAWIQPSRNRGPRMLLLFACLGILFVGAAVWYYQLAQTREQWLRDEIRKAETRMSEQRESRSRAQNLETSTQMVQKAETFLRETRRDHEFILRQFNLLLSSIEDAWVQSISLTADGVEMTLLTLAPSSIPVMMQRMRGLPHLSEPELRSRKEVNLGGQRVIQLIFSAELEHPSKFANPPQ